MFNKLKQKIADGVEGVSPGRQTPLRGNRTEGLLPFKYQRFPSDKHHNHHRKYNSTLDNSLHSSSLDNSSLDTGLYNRKSNPQEVLARVHHLLEVGRAQAQNNGKIDDASDSSSSSPRHKTSNSQTVSPKHSLDHTDNGRSTPTSVETEGPVFESTPNQSFASPTVPTPIRKQRRTSTSSNVSMTGEERSDVESDADGSVRTDHLSIADLRELYRKQDKTLKRYKKKFSEVVDAYKALHKEKEKLESTLTSGQDKQLRRISELKETIELEQEGKRHLEETLRLHLEEKDDQIGVLQTQVQLLKTKYGLSSPASDIDVASSTAVVNGAVPETDVTIKSLQDQIKDLKAEIDNAQIKIARSEQEKKTTIEEVMENMQHSLTEQEDLKSELCLLRDELNKRDVTILQMREEEDRMENNLRHELSKEITEEMLSGALKEQEKELKALFTEKENAVKTTFAEKVHDLQRVLEESEKQKELSIQQKQDELTKTVEKMNELKDELKQSKETEEKVKEKMKVLLQEKDEWVQKHAVSLEEIQVEKLKMAEVVTQHEKQLSEKQSEGTEQAAKIKRTMQSKVYELQEQLRKKTQELNDTTSKQKTELEQKVKEAQQQMQADHAKASRKLEVKISDMKKMIKEVRGKLAEKETKCNELEASLQCAQTEADQWKSFQQSTESLNVSLSESEEKIRTLNDSITVKDQNVEQLQQLTSTLKNQVASTNEKITELSNDVENKKNEILDWRSQYEEQSKRLNNVSDELCHVQTEMGKKENALVELQTVVNEKNATISVLQTTENELRGQIESMKSSVTDSEKEQALKFEQLVEAQKKQYDELGRTLRENSESETKILKEKLQSVEEALEKISAELISEQKEKNLQVVNVQNLESKLSDLSERLVAAEKVSSQKDLQLLETQNNLSAENERAVRLDTELSNAKEKTSSLEEELKELLQKLTVSSNEVATLSSNLDSANKLLQSKEDEFNSALSSKALEINELNEKIKQIKQENVTEEETLKNRLASLTDQHKEDMLQKQSEFESILREKEDEWRFQVTKLVNDKDASVENLNVQLEEMRKQELAEVEERYTKRMDELNAEWNVKLGDLHKQHQDEHDKIKHEHSLGIQEKDRLIASMSSDVEDMKNQHEEREKEMLKLITDHEQLKVNMNDLQKINSNSEEHLRKFKQDSLAKSETLQKDMDELTSKYTKEIEGYKSLLHDAEQRKNDAFVELNKTHAEDRNILLKQIEDVNVDMTALKDLCDKKDREMQSLQETLQSSSDQHQSSLAQEKAESLEKLQALETLWKEKQQNLEKKFKKIISDRDRKSKENIAENKSKYEEKIQELESNVNTVQGNANNQLQEKDEEISSLTAKIEELSKRIEETEAKCEDELSLYKSREADAWKQLEQEKHDRNISNEKQEKQISMLESELLKSKNTVEELQLRVASGEHTSKEIDGKLSEMLQQKNSLEKRLTDNEHDFEEKIRCLETEKSQMKQQYEETIRNLTDQHLNEMKNAEKEKESEVLLKATEHEESNRTKLLEMKKKAETKIAKLKKDFAEKSEESERKMKDLQQRVASLEHELEDTKTTYEKQTGELNDRHKATLENKLGELQKASSSEKNQSEAELCSLKGELETIKGELSRREEKIDNMTLEKMEALKAQKADLLEEHEIELKTVKEQAQKDIELIEKKLTAKVEEKEFEYSSRVKQMIKEFQSQLGMKDREIQESVQEAIEVAQKDERRIITEYDEQIMELQKELRLREEEMLELRTESEQQLDQLHLEKNELYQEHKTELEKLESDYRQRLDDLVKRHEEQLVNASRKDVSIEESELKMTEQMNDIEQSYVARIQNLEEQHNTNMTAQEKKYKLQLKKVKNEMRKLLAEKGVTLPNGGEEFDTVSSTPCSDNELDASELSQLKDKVAVMTKELKSLREREKVLAMQVEHSPVSPGISRPATLQLDNSLDDSFGSSPKTPQPIEYEYLRNILFNYMMGTQRKQMAKVLTALVHFTPSQVKQVLAKVDEQESQTEKKSGSWL